MLRSPVQPSAPAFASLAASPGPARVLAVFSKAIYLRLSDTAIVALTDQSVPRGPVHIRCARLPNAIVGERANVTATAAIELDGQLLVPDGHRWLGVIPAREVLAEAADVATRTLNSRVWPIPIDLMLVAECAAHGDLPRLVELLGGLGPGLTPSGDDVLAGLFLVLSDGLDDDRCVALAGSVATHDISKAFLIHAARCQSIEPAHNLLGALAERDDAAIGDALAALSGFGATSGQALAFGILTAVAHLVAFRMAA